MSQSPAPATWLFLGGRKTEITREGKILCQQIKSIVWESSISRAVRKRAPELPNIPNIPVIPN